LHGHADLEGDDAEKMISVGMIGVTLKNLAVPRLRLFQVAGLMGAQAFLNESIQPGVLACVFRYLFAFCVRASRRASIHPRRVDISHREFFDHNTHS